MIQISEDQSGLPAPAPEKYDQSGRYVYCVALTGEEVILEGAGIEGRSVYSLVNRGVSALVHDCSPQLYRPSGQNAAAEWVLAHHRVVQAAWSRWGSVLPMVFNTIVKGDRYNAQENLTKWLEREHRSLQNRLEAFVGKAEYGVQVFWDPAAVGAEVAGKDPAIQMLEKDIENSPRGLAYMYRQKLERLLKKGLEARAVQEMENLIQRLNPCTDNFRVEKTKDGGDGRQMLMNLSCLVCNERLPGLEAQLDVLSKREGFSVRLAGPLPPYSFC